MFRKCILISLILLTLCLCNNAVSAVVITEHVCVPANEHFNGARLGTDPNRFAQAFEVSGSPTIIEITLDLYRFQYSAGNVIVELHPDSDGVPSSEVEASVLLPVSDVPDTSEYCEMPVSEIPWGQSDWTSFQWGPGGSPTLSAGKWWIVCYLSSDSDAFMNWGGEKQGWDYSVEPYELLEPYGPMNDTVVLNDDGTWSIVVSLDMNFSVIGGSRQTKDTDTAVTADPTTVGGGGVCTIEVSVDAVGTTVAGLVNLSAPNGGTLGDTTLSLINGSRTTTWTAPETEGAYNIEAYYQGQEYGLYNFTDSNNSTSVTVEVEDPELDYRDTDTYQTLEPTSTEALQTIAITVNVKDKTTGNSIEGGGTVTFSCNEGGTFFDQNPWSCTVASGMAAAQWKAPGAGGTFTIHADYSGCTWGTKQYGPSGIDGDVTVDYVERDTTTTVSVSPDEPYVGKTAYVTVRVEDAQTGFYVPSGIVMLEDDAPYGGFKDCFKYIQDGKAKTIWYAPGEACPGQYTITATYIEDGVYNVANGTIYHSSDANTTVTVVKDDDGVKLTYMSQWIADYSCCSGRNNIPNTEHDAGGFTDALETELGWTGKPYPNKNARAKYMRGLWQDAREDSYMDTHDFTYYSGHGSPDYITFTHPEDYREFYWSHGIDFWGKPTWGDKDAEWLALSACKVLSNPGGWAATMDGLHLICGFHTTMLDSATFGEVFASLLIKESFDDEPKTVKQAWFLAGDQTLPNWTKQVVIGETEGILSGDHIWGQGEVWTDPNPTTTYWFTKRFVGNQSPVADAGGPYTAVAGQDKKLDGSGTTDADSGSNLTYCWDLYELADTDDGDWDRDGSDETDDDCDVWGCYPDDAGWLFPGAYRIWLIVIDDTRNVSRDWADVTVDPAPPSPKASREPITQNQADGGIEIVDKFDPCNLPTEANMPLFSVQGIDIGYYEMMNIAGYWRMTCDSAGLDAVGNWNMVDGNHELMVNRLTGSIMYIDRDNAYKCPEESIIFFDPNWLPDPCQARDLAEQFLSDNDIGINPAEMVFDSVTDISGGYGVKGSQDPSILKPFQRSVNYRRKIDAWRPGQPSQLYPVVGSGGKISVIIDVYEKVRMFVKIWRELDQEEIIDIHPADEAIEDFHRLGPKALLPVCWVPPCTRIDIENVSLGYYEDDFVTEQHIFYPVYILDLTCHKDKTAQQVQVYMSAVTPPLEAIISAPASANTVNYSEAVMFSGSAVGGTPPYIYKWSSDVDGLLSTQTNFVTSSLSVNYLSDSCICEVLPHTISLTVTDAYSFEATEFINVKVRGFCTDFNRDDCVNFKDFAELAYCWLAQLGEPNYDEKVDLNADSIVDINDLCVLSNEWLNIIEPNLVGYWKFDEVSGSTAYDSSYNGNNGTVIGDPSWVTGTIGGALLFDGDGDYVNCGNDPIFDITDQITVAAWIKVNAFDKNWQTIIAKGDDSWRLARDVDRDSLAFGCTGLSDNWIVRGNVDVNDSEWHHVAGVYDGSEIYLYVDGELDVSDVASGIINISSYNVYIGDNEEYPGRYWNGLIDDFRIYNRGLSEGEIKYLAGVE